MSSVQIHIILFISVILYFNLIYLLMNIYSIINQDCRLISIFLISNHVIQCEGMGRKGRTSPDSDKQMIMMVTRWKLLAFASKEEHTATKLPISLGPERLNLPIKVFILFLFLFFQYPQKGKNGFKWTWGYSGMVKNIKNNFILKNIKK